MSITPAGAAGMIAATTHATSIWAEDAAALVLDFLGTRPEGAMVETIVASSVGVLPAPPDNRAWGGVIYGLRMAGKIVKTGRFENAKTSNGSPKPVWAKAVS